MKAVAHEGIYKDVAVFQIRYRAEPSVRERVYQLFKHILSSCDSFQFISAKSKSLVLVTAEVLGHATWYVEAILALAVKDLFIYCQLWHKR